MGIQVLLSPLSVWPVAHCNGRGQSPKSLPFPLKKTPNKTTQHSKKTLEWRSSKVSLYTAVNKVSFNFPRRNRPRKDNYLAPYPGNLPFDRQDLQLLRALSRHEHFVTWEGN